MDKIFNALEQNGGNTVPNLMQWLKDSKVVDSANENNVQEMLSQVSDKGNVTLDGFKNVMTDVASQNNTSLDEILKKLASSGQAFMTQATGALKNLGF